MKKSNKLLGCFLLLFVSITTYAQTIIPYVLKPEDREALQNKIREKQLQAATEKEQADKKAKAAGIPTRITTKEGKLIELQKFRNNFPLYYTNYNTVAAATISTNKLYSGGGLGLSLSGNGEVLGIWDGGGVLTSHEQLTGRATQIDAPSAANFHATHVAGTMIGSGTNYAAARGMAFQANLRAYEWTSDLSEMAAEALNGLKISNHSYGYVSGWNDQIKAPYWAWVGDVTISTTEDYSYGFYDSEAQSWDELSNDYPYYLIAKSAGNDRLAGPAAGTGHYYIDPTTGNWGVSSATRSINGGTSGYDCISHQALAKNILTVGAVADIPGGYSNPSGVSLLYFSGTGPTDDGRIKPDLVANGELLTSATTPNNNSYVSMSGTSMATPSVSGSIALLNQHQKNLYGSHVYRSSTMKGILIHTADEAGSAPGPDYYYGWGLMNTAKAASLMSQDAQNCINIKEVLLNQGQQIVLDVKKKATENLKVTICWNDPAGTPVSASLNPTTAMLVNDVDIRINGNGSNYQPYILGGKSNPSASATTGDNTIDNVEQINIANSTDGIYKITISHKGTLVGSSQVVSVIISGNDNITQDLVLTSPTINTTQSYWANNSITAGTSFGVVSPGKVTFVAGNYIHLTDGFSVSAGGEFTGYINDRLKCTSGTFMRSDAYSYSEPEYSTPQVSIANNASATQITMYPNPASERVTINYSARSNAVITLSDIKGNVIKTLTGSFSEAHFDASDLKPGVYVVNVSADGTHYTPSKLIIK